MSNRGRHKKSKEHVIIQIFGSKIAERMMHYQIEQENPPNLDVFMNNATAGSGNGGFNWCDTKEGFEFWDTLLYDKLQSHHLFKKWQNERSQRLH